MGNPRRLDVSTAAEVVTVLVQPDDLMEVMRLAREEEPDKPCRLAVWLQDGPGHLMGISVWNGDGSTGWTVPADGAPEWLESQGGPR